MSSSRFHPDGVAAIVLHGESGSTIPRRGRISGGGRVAAPVADGPTAIVLGIRAKRTAWSFVGALAIAVAIQAVAGFAAILLVPSAVAARRERRVRPPIRVEHVVDLMARDVSPPPPRSPPPVSPAKVARAREPTPGAAPAPAPAPPRDTVPSPPAEAASVVAADDDADQPLDFTGFDISLGRGQRYAGGITASFGTNTRPPIALAGGGARISTRPGGNGASRSSPVGVPAKDWNCPWPSEADALQTNREVVVLRVAVRADGSVASAELVADPGHGFGQVALDCARRHRFVPATGANGQPIAATSPPIRVNFTR